MEVTRVFHGYKTLEAGAMGACWRRGAADREAIGTFTRGALDEDGMVTSAAAKFMIKTSARLDFKICGMSEIRNIIEQLKLLSGAAD